MSERRALRKLGAIFSFNPHLGPGVYMQLGLAYYLEGRCMDAIGVLERGLSWYPENVFIHIPLVAAYMRADRPREAELEAAQVRRLHPFFEVEYPYLARVDGIIILLFIAHRVNIMG